MAGIGGQRARLRRQSRWLVTMGLYALGGGEPYRLFDFRRVGRRQEAHRLVVVFRTVFAETKNTLYDQAPAIEERQPDSAGRRKQRHALAKRCGKADFGATLLLPAGMAAIAELSKNGARHGGRPGFSEQAPGHHREGCG